MAMKLALLLAVVVAAAIMTSDAACPNSCSGHGTCDGEEQCTCYARKDGTTDELGLVVPAWIRADCSERSCPYAQAWFDIPKAGWDNVAHRNAECSNAGVCDRSTGQCQCFPGYEGRACDRTVCPNSCSGHGTCQTQKQFHADHAEALGGTPGVAYTTAWDALKTMGCKCEAGFRGPDCSQKECPSMADAQGGPGGGIGGGLINYPSINNMQHRDCSGRGTCDYSTGLCVCIKGSYGEGCQFQSAMQV